MKTQSALWSRWKSQKVSLCWYEMLSPGPGLLGNESAPLLHTPPAPAPGLVLPQSWLIEG